MHGLKLSEIWIYPIKSLGGIRVSSAKVMQKGLQYDRRWMLIDSDNQFMTQRTHHTMALFKLSQEQNGFTITHATEKFFLPYESNLLPTPISSKVWDDDVTVFEVSTSASEWFSNQLGLTCKLVQFPEQNARLVDAQYHINHEHVSLADGYPFLVIGQNSLNDLNSRLQNPVPMNRFRPNLVFTGGEPYEEDTWRNFSIGKNKFAGVKPCSRCVLTTINQQTGEQGKEPLATLAKYRQKENKIYFGQNVLTIDYDEIYEGDEIVVK
jgi:uncharacterized protein